MSTAVAGPRHARSEPARTGSVFTGTFGLLRLYLRRDRIVLPLWVLLLSLPLASVYIGSIETVYPTAAPTRGVRGLDHGQPRPARALRNVYNDSVGAVGIWKAGVFHTLIAVAVILTVIRHTRAEEETGRAELLGLDRRRTVREPHRRADTRVRRVHRHRLDRHSGSAHHRRAAGGFAGFRPRACRFGPRLLRRRRGGGAAQHRRPDCPRHRVRGARRRLRAACGG